MVEKKSPLVMPPDFDELPIPKQNDNQAETSKNSIKELITENSSDNINNSNENNDLEELKNSDRYKKAISLFPDLEVVNVKNLEDENNEWF